MTKTKTTTKKVEVKSKIVTSTLCEFEGKVIDFATVCPGCRNDGVLLSTERGATKYHRGAHRPVRNRCDCYDQAWALIMADPVGSLFIGYESEQRAGRTYRIPNENYPVKVSEAAPSGKTLVCESENVRFATRLRTAMTQRALYDDGPLKTDDHRGESLDRGYRHYYPMTTRDVTILEAREAKEKAERDKEKSKADRETKLEEHIESFAPTATKAKVGAASRRYADVDFCLDVCVTLLESDHTRVDVITLSAHPRNVLEAQTMARAIEKVYRYMSTPKGKSEAKRFAKGVLKLHANS